MATYTLTAIQVPVSPVASGVYSPASAPLCSETLITGDGPGGEVRVKGNKNATRIDLTGRIGGGGYAVYTGLDLTFTTGRTLTIAAGQAMIDGVVTTASQTATIDPNIARAYIWLARAGTISVVNNSLTPPAGAYCYLGSCVTNATDITSTDQSGILYIRGGGLWRRTADTGVPADTPSASIQFFTKTSARLYWWDGVSYWLVSCGTTAQGGQLTKALTASTTLSATEVLNASIRITDGGGLTDGFILTWPAASITLGDRWAVRNDSGKAGRLTLSTGSDYIYLNDDDQCIVEYSDGDLQELGTNHVRWKAKTVSGTVTYTQFEQVEANSINFTPTGTAIAEWPTAGALENRGRFQVGRNANTSTVPITWRTSSVTEDNYQSRILPGESVAHFVQNDGSSVRANTRPYTTVKGVTHDNSATYTATDMEALGFILQVTGTLTAARNFALPTCTDKLWLIYNNTAGGFSITVKTAAGTGVVVPNGSRVLVYCDGTNILRGSGGPLAFGGDVVAMATTSASGTVANTTTEGTLFGTIVGNAQIPASTLQPGRSIRVKVRGTLSTAAIPGTLNIKLKLGSTQIVATGAQTPTISLTTRYFEVDVLLTCRTTGATGTVIAQGMMIHMPTATATASVLWEMQNTATVTIDTTAALTIDCTATWATADAANSIVATNCVVELLN